MSSEKRLHERDYLKAKDLYKNLGKLRKLKDKLPDLYENKLPGVPELSEVSEFPEKLEVKGGLGQLTPRSKDGFVEQEIKDSNQEQELYKKEQQKQWVETQRQQHLNILSGINNGKQVGGAHADRERQRRNDQGNLEAVTKRNLNRMIIGDFCKFPSGGGQAVPKQSAYVYHPPRQGGEYHSHVVTQIHPLIIGSNADAVRTREALERQQRINSSKSCCIIS